MLAPLLAHCLFIFVPQPKSQANPQHSNKKTLHGIYPDEISETATTFPFMLA
jgi:hypothetical protein